MTGSNLPALGASLSNSSTRREPPETVDRKLDMNSHPTRFFEPVEELTADRAVGANPGWVCNQRQFTAMSSAIPEQKFVRLQVYDQRAKWSFAFLWLFTVAIFARPEDMFPSLGQLHLTLAFGLCAGLTYLGALTSGKARLLWTSELRLVLLLTGWYIAGIPFAIWRGGSLQVLTDWWLRTLFAFFLLTQTLVTLERIRKLLWAIIISELVVAGFSIVFSSSVLWVGDRMFGVNLGILSWNFLGIAVAVTIPYIAAMFISCRSFLKRILLLAAAGSMVWMLVLTASRSGFLDVLLSVGLTSLLVLRGSSRGRTVGFVIAPLLVVALGFAPGAFWQRIGTMWNTSEDGGASQTVAAAEMSQEDHEAVLIHSIQYTLERPIFGLGLGNFPLARGTELGRPDAWMGTHNTFTQISSEAGVPALVLFIALLATASRNMKRVGTASPNGPERTELSLMARATLASLLSLAFAICFAHIGYEYFLFYPVAIAIGIQQSARTTAATSAAPNGQFVSTSQIASASVTI
jgi:O-antigen ligase